MNKTIKYEKSILRERSISNTSIDGCGYKSNYVSYHNCMEWVKLDYISKKRAAHIAAQCKVFVLNKIMAN